MPQARTLRCCALCNICIPKLREVECNVRAQRRDGESASLQCMNKAPAFARINAVQNAGSCLPGVHVCRALSPSVLALASTPQKQAQLWPTPPELSLLLVRDWPTFARPAPEGIFVGRFANIFATRAIFGDRRRCARLDARAPGAKYLKCEKKRRLTRYA